MFYNVSNTNVCIWIVNIITITIAFNCFNTKRVKYGIITIKINHLWSCFTFLIFAFNREFHSICEI